MKKLTLFITVLLFSVSLFANHTSKKYSEQIAYNYYKHFASKSITNYSIANSFSVEYKGITTYYVFNFKSGGFVIVSADDAVIPVLGSSYKGELKQGENRPNIDYWLQSYGKQIKYIIDNKYDNSETLKKWNNIKNEKFAADTKGKDVTPLLTTTWSQESGYDDYCPTGTPTGCVATSMAQIMNYHEFPATGVSWHAYNHPDYGVQSAYFSTTNYDWATMPDNSGSDAVALLMYHCGVSVDMNYATDGSGAQSRDVTYALANYFKYSQSINYVQKASYTNTTWKTLLKAELDNSKPVYYSGSGAAGGHAFVCDGYNASDDFHFNWGWGGYANGYYTIGGLNPAGSDFNDDNAAVIGIEPAAAGEEELMWVRKFTDFPATSTYSAYISAVDANVAWAIGRDGSGGGANYCVFTKTTDRGATWTGTEVTEFGTAFSMIYGISDSTAYIAVWGTGADNHIIKTTDGGTSWNSVLTGAGAASFFNVVHFFDENNGFAQGDPEGGEFELYTTTNAGVDWTRVSGANIPDPVSGEYGITGMYDAVGNTVWFTTNKGYIYKSTDKGLTWNKYNILPSPSGDTYIDVSFSDDALTGLAIVDDYYGSAAHYYRYSTTNGGETWTEVTSPTGNFYNSDVCAIPGTVSSFVSVGSDYQTPHEGVSYSTDGGQTWIDYAEYYKNFQFLSVDMVSETKGFAGSFCGDYSDGMWVLGETGSSIIPNFEADKTDVGLNEDVIFTNTSIGVADSLHWDFGANASPATATGSGPFTVTYSAIGQKTVSLILYADGEEYTEIKENYILVSLMPNADFTYVCDSVDSKIVYFTNTSTGTNELTTYHWNFGDGSSGDVENPTHTYYMEDHEYAVKLTVKNSEICQDDALIAVTTTYVPLNTETDITAFSFAEQTGVATINATAHTVNVKVTYGTDLTNLTPTINVSVGAQVSPTTGTAQDFTNPVTYIVTAEDGTTTQDWTVTVTTPETFTVTFNVNMNDAENFTAGTDTVNITGSMAGWAEPGTNADYIMTDTDEDGIYTIALVMEAGDYEYKYFMNSGWTGGEWESGSDRTFTVSADMVIDDVWGNLNAIDEMSINGLNIYPNPSNGIFFIKSERALNTQLFIRDINGKLILSQKLNSDKNMVDISSSQAGIYFMQMITDNNKIINYKILLK